MEIDRELWLLSRELWLLIRELWLLIGSDTRLCNCSPGFKSSNLPRLQWIASP
jgi:hypothetical protein